MFRYSTKIHKNGKGKIIALVLLFSTIFSAFVFLFIPYRNNIANAVATSGYILIEQSTGRVLKEENAHLPLPMASTTKIMTALVVLENSNINDVVSIPKQAVGVEGSSIYLKLNEKMTVRDLLYGLMLRSGNDSAVALAIHVGGSVDNFIKLMNAKADMLGLKNTRFSNPHGLSDKNHYTSAYDLAQIASCAMNNDVFREIVNTKLYVVKGETEEENKYFANKNRILYNYSGGNGIKTGYTTEAGRCLVASSQKDGMQVIAVALNRYDYFDFCSQLMDYAYENYKMQKVLDRENCYKEVSVKKGGKIKKAQLFPLKDLYYPLKKDEIENVHYEINAIDTIVAPHENKTSCGSIKIYVNNCLKFEEKLYTIYNIEKKFSISDIWSK